MLGKILYWIGSIIQLLLSGLIVFFELEEYYIVAIAQELDQYQFGPINDNPWFYSNPSTYSTVLLVNAALISIMFILCLSGLISNNKRRVVASMIGFVVILVAIKISSLISM